LHERAARFIASPPKGPWFLSVGFDETHRDSCQGRPETGTRFSKHSPYDPRRLDARYCLPPPTIPDLPATRGDMASFKEGARRLDERMGFVLAALDRSGAAANTLVIVTTDHGIAWPGMKCSLTDHGIGVMLLLRGPGGFAGGKVVDAMVTHLDLFPTVCEVAGIAPPDWLEGKSLVPLAVGKVASLHEAIFAEQDWHEQSEVLRAVRTLRYKYIRRFEPTGPKAANCDEGPTKQVMLEAGFFGQALGPERLFDLYLDPQEACNRSEDPACAPVLAMMRRSLDAWMRRTRDPLLSGQPVTPPGLRGQFRKSVPGTAPHVEAASSPLSPPG
jgi:N-sulfoglucosamine sulfohydrolase